MTPEDMSDAFDDLRADQEEQERQAQAVTAAFDTVFGPGAALAFQTGWLRAAHATTEESARSMRAVFYSNNLPIPTIH